MVSKVLEKVLKVSEKNHKNKNKNFYDDISGNASCGNIPSMTPYKKKVAKVLEKVAKVSEKVAEKYHCELCDYTTSRNSNYIKHCLTAKHNKVAKVAKVADKFYCELCDYRTSYKSNYNKHISTMRHCVAIEEYEKYNNINEQVIKNDDNFLKKLIIENMKMTAILVESHGKQLEKMTNIIMKNNPEISNINTITNSHNTINNNNQKFNLNIFLNENCKDAFNISDYINNIQLQLNDLEETARLGYTDGITKIISDRVKETGLTRRPFHCTDSKREIVYVKEGGVWEKENSDKPRMKKMISNVIHKNLQQLSAWQEAHPECTDLSNKKGEEFLNIMIQVNGGDQTEREKKEEKILKNILKEVIVEKI